MSRSFDRKLPVRSAALSIRRLDSSGLPHSDELSVTERCELVSPERLRVTITVTDPKTFTAPWQMQLNYTRQPGVRMKGDPCAEKLWNPRSTSKAG